MIEGLSPTISGIRRRDYNHRLHDRGIIGRRKWRIITTSQLETMMRLKVYDENGRYVSGCEVPHAHMFMDEVRDAYARGCGHIDAEGMAQCGYPVEKYTFVAENYVTYSFGSNLHNCFAIVEVPYDVDTSFFVQSQIGPKYAFIYDQMQWVHGGKTQQELYGLRQVPLQPQVLRD
jgi:hypothetical protein